MVSRGGLTMKIPVNHPVTLVFILFFPLLLSCASTPRIAIEETPPLEVSSYSIKVPPGTDWRWSIQEDKGIIRIKKVRMSVMGSMTPPVGATLIQVFESGLNEDKWHLSEEGVADNHRRIENIELGINKGEFELGAANSTILSLNGKTLYALSYRKHIGGVFKNGAGYGGPWNEEAVFYLYFPPTFKHNHAFYGFVISEVFQRGWMGAVRPHLEQINPVISSFKIITPVISEGAQRDISFRSVVDYKRKWTPRVLTSSLGGIHHNFYDFWLGGFSQL
jgi:hypothetical protein